MKRYCALVLLCMSLHIQSVPINDPIIGMIDGSMLDGSKIKNIITFLVELRQLLHGKKNTQTQLFEGIILIGNIYYSIHQLAAIENECAIDCPESECECPLKKQDFIKALLQAKILFEKAHEISQKDSKGTKQMSRRLIQQWSKDNNKSASYLLAWTEVPEHKEQEAFDAAICSFVDFELFLEDLTAFLKDLVASCPKAYQQYKESLKQHVA